MKVFAYVRVSTEKQKEGQGLDYQSRDLKGYIKRIYKQDLVKNETLFEEIISGTLEYSKRPVLKEIYDMADEGDVLVVNRLDRLGRTANVINNAIQAFYKKGIYIIAIDFPGLKKPTKEDIATGKNIVDELALGMYLQVIEYDKKNLVYRLKRGRENARQRAIEEGKHYAEGRQRIFTLNKDDPNYEKLKKALDYAITLKKSGKTFRSISDILFNEMGVKASAGTICREFNRHQIELSNNIIRDMVDEMNRIELERRNSLADALNSVVSCYENYSHTIPMEVIDLVTLICEKEHFYLDDSEEQ